MFAARCVAHVLEVCGIPSKEPGQNALNLDPKALRIVAKKAVSCLYWLGMPITNDETRAFKAQNFQTNYSPRLGPEIGASPYLIGVWDAVAAIGWQRFFPDWAYDRHFTKDVRYARHLQSIDETRRDFLRVPWGGSGTVLWPDRKNEPEQFDQIWFAGNHADIGGSYPENESRLSDITLCWMVDFVTKEIPTDGQIFVDPDFLRLYPSSDGMMHDECMVGIGGTSIPWHVAIRDVPDTAKLHDTVYERLRMTKVRNFTSYGPYRPAALRKHGQAKEFFGPELQQP